MLNILYTYKMMASAESVSDTSGGACTALGSLTSSV